MLSATVFEEFVLRAGAVAGALVVIGGAVAALMRYTTKRFAASVTEIVREELDPITHRTEQLIPNGGSSLADSIRRVEAGQIGLRAEQAAIRQALESHLRDHRAIPSPGE